VRIIKTNSIEQLIAECRKEKPRAQKKLYDRFSGKMFAVCMRYTKNRVDAEDVFQEGFVKVFQNINQLKNSELLEAWMKRIFVHTALRFLDKRKLLVYPELVENYEHDLKYHFSPCDHNDMLCMISELPDGFRTVFNLYVIDGYSHQEIAQTLGIKESTSRSQLGRARQLLQQKLLEQDSIPLKTKKHG
jgi:RNA polymerase sigma-70 factor (ECF subfamily)